MPTTPIIHLFVFSVAVVSASHLSTEVHYFGLCSAKVKLKLSSQYFFGIQSTKIHAGLLIDI